MHGHVSLQDGFPRPQPPGQAGYWGADVQVAEDEVEFLTLLVYKAAA